MTPQERRLRAGALVASAVKTAMPRPRKLQEGTTVVRGAPVGKEQA